MTASSPPVPRIVFEDTHVLVVSKPSGLLSQGERSGDTNLVDWARQYVGRNYIGLIHRLDRNTSGLLVLGKRTKAAARLTTALQEGRLEREYLAWLHGTLPGPARWRHFLQKNEDQNQVRAVRQAPPGDRSFKEAVLSVEPVSATSWKSYPLTLARFRLETGRSHQIRVQAATEGFPLLGDPRYGKRGDPFPRLALHSTTLSFPHPMSGEILHFEEPLPTELQLDALTLA